MTRVLVTGGSGFIGTNVVEHYLRRGDEVINADIEPPQCPNHYDVWKKLDILDAPVCRRFISDFSPEIVLHMAARTDLRGRSMDDYGPNTIGTENVVAGLLAAKQLRRVVFASSMLVCRIGYLPRDDFDYCPTTAYGSSKVRGEELVRSLGSQLPWILVRPTSIWGPWFRSPYRDFFDAVRRGFYFHPKGLRIKRSYGYVGNIVHLLASLCEDTGATLLGRTIYLADFEATEVKAWADLIATEFGGRPVHELPRALFDVAARLGDVVSRVGIRAPITTFRLKNMLTEMVVDTSPLQGISTVLPYTTNDGVRSTCEWMRRHG